MFNGDEGSVIFICFRILGLVYNLKKEFFFKEEGWVYQFIVRWLGLGVDVVQAIWELAVLRFERGYVVEFGYSRRVQRKCAFNLLFGEASVFRLVFGEGWGGI